jgi:hypothetical protein
MFQKVPDFTGIPTDLCKKFSLMIVTIAAVHYRAKPGHIPFVERHPLSFAPA